MIVFDWFRRLFGKLNKKTIPAGVIEKEFGTYPVASQNMADNINLWYAMYTNQPPWVDCDIRPLGLPAAIGREMAQYALMELQIVVSGGARADFLQKQIDYASRNFQKCLEQGLCLGGVALKPFVDKNSRILVDINTTGFTPTRFDEAGKVVGGVFKSLPLRQGDNWFVRMEYHDFQARDGGPAVYVIENKAFLSDQSGGIGSRVSLDSVDEWADLPERQELEGLEGPLFAYFKPPATNCVEPESQLGMSIYAGAVAELIKQADEQWQLIRWEYKSGKRKIYADGVDAGGFDDDIFVIGDFSGSGDFFQVFSPDFRNDPLYSGYQYILKQIEFNVGLAFGTISDPQSVERTATEILASKHRQRVTESAIQREFQSTLDDLLHAMDAWCNLAQLAPSGEYTVEYNWGDGVLDDPDMQRQDKAMDVTLVREGLLTPWEFRMKWCGEDEETAKKMLLEQNSREPYAEEEGYE